MSLYQGRWDLLHLGVRWVSLLKGKQRDVATLGLSLGGRESFTLVVGEGWSLR